MGRIVIWAQKHAFMVHLVITSSKEELTCFLCFLAPLVMTQETNQVHLKLKSYYPIRQEKIHDFLPLLMSGFFGAVCLVSSMVQTSKHLLFLFSCNLN